MDQVRPFTADDAEPAGALLAVRHAEHRRHEGLLSARYEAASAATSEVQALLDAGATGSVAVEDGTVTGFLLGYTKSSPVWGPNTWVESAGHAVSDAETARDLYGHAAAAWQESGHDAHYVLVPAHDTALVDAWFRLGFGLQHVHGIRAVPTAPTPTPERVTVRPAERTDVPVLAELALELPRHQGLSPTFSAGATETLEEALADWEESFDEEGMYYVVAEVGGRVVGCAGGCPLEKSGAHTALSRPERAGFLGFAVVLPEARGLGAGRALGEAVLAWTADQAFSCAVVDWRATNLLSSRTWPRLGFRPSFLRLHRRLGY